MKCPTCEETLLMSEKNGIEIDYCPKCRGVWLDRGELDKIIERSEKPYTPTNDYPRNDYRSETDRRKDSYGYDDRRRYPDKQRKRKSFLDDIFDF